MQGGERRLCTYIEGGRLGGRGVLLARHGLDPLLGGGGDLGDEGLVGRLGVGGLADGGEEVHTGKLLHLCAFWLRRGGFLGGRARQGRRRAPHTNAFAHSGKERREVPWRWPGPGGGWLGSRGTCSEAWFWVGRDLGFWVCCVGGV